MKRIKITSDNTQELMPYLTPEAKKKLKQIMKTAQDKQRKTRTKKDIEYELEIKYGNVVNKKNTDYKAVTVRVLKEDDAWLDENNINKSKLFKKAIQILQHNMRYTKKEDTQITEKEIEEQKRIIEEPE